MTRYLADMTIEADAVLVSQMPDLRNALTEYAGIEHEGLPDAADETRIVYGLSFEAEDLWEARSVVDDIEEAALNVLEADTGMVVTDKPREAP